MYLIKDKDLKKLFENPAPSLPAAAREIPASISLEEEKEEQEQVEDHQSEVPTTTERQGSIDFAAMPTSELFKLAAPVFETVIERMNARASAIDASLTQLLAQH